MERQEDLNQSFHIVLITFEVLRGCMEFQSTTRNVKLKCCVEPEIFEILKKMRIFWKQSYITQQPLSTLLCHLLQIEWWGHFFDAKTSAYTHSCPLMTIHAWSCPCACLHFYAHSHPLVPLQMAILENIHRLLKITKPK